MTAPIVFVDDDTDDLLLFKRACATCQVKNPILSLESGVHLLTMLDSLEVLPALILLDFNMPVKNGLEVLEQLKKHPIYSKVPVIILSGSTDQAGINKAYKLGANSYLTKPDSEVKLIEMIKLIKDYWLGFNKPVKVTKVGSWLLDYTLSHQN